MVRLEGVAGLSMAGCYWVLRSRKAEGSLGAVSKYHQGGWVRVN
jgi:hypothetical protein